MDYEAAFLQAIREEPDEDLHRLAYADWLDDHRGRSGSARAAFIRAQCAAARLDEDDPRRLSLEREADDLREEHEKEWVAPLGAATMFWRFDRGFVDSVAVMGTRELGEVLQAAPIRNLSLRTNHTDIQRLRTVPHIDLLEELELADCDLRDDPIIETLTASPWPRLQRLLLRENAVEGPFVRHLAASPLFDRLTHLDFRGNASFGDRAAQALALPGSNGPRPLISLGLADTNLTAYGVRDLLLARSLGNVRRLDVSLQRGGRRLEPLASGLTLESIAMPLEKIDLSNHSGAAEIVSRAIAPARRLRKLALREVALGDGLRNIAGNPGLSGLTSLDVRNNQIGVEAAKSLAHSEHITGLRKLRIGRNPIRDTGVKALCASKNLEKLTELDVGRTGIGGPGIEAVLEAAFADRLISLDLSGNYVGLGSIAAIASSERLQWLRQLHLGDLQLDAEAARLLAASPHLRRLQTLGLDDNNLGEAGAAALADSPYLSRRLSLFLGRADVGLFGHMTLQTRFNPVGIR